MARVKNEARRALTWLGAIVVGLYGMLAVGVVTGGASWTPDLALDLAGGREIVLAPVLTEGSEETITQTDLDQAVEIIRRRIDASGVSEAEISTQGQNIVVALPGNPSEETVDLVRQSAQLQFRPVLEIGYSDLTTDTSATPEPSATASDEATDESSAEPTAEATAEATAEPSADESAAPAATDEATAEPSAEATDESSAEASTEPAEGTDASSLEWITDDVQAKYDALDCTKAANLAGVTPGDPTKADAVCDQDGYVKYILGPVEMDGTDIATATSGPEYNTQGNLTGRYEVRMEFTSDGGDTFAGITGRIKDLESPRNQFAMVLDGVVISAPSVSTTITGGQASITGEGITQESAAQLANQLKFGALPMTLEVQSEQQISATLGADQLQKGLIAGLIGLVLVVIYSLIQYRALGLVTVGSLVIAGGITYGLIAVLSWTIGYRLSLAGVAGLIVAIGVTADSFIVYFERVRDELREGRSLQSAIDHGWRRARRTILASDAINILAAVVLYVLAVGGVRGFAFTLGLTTLVDILVVFLFTHPVLMLLAKVPFFAHGHPWSGLDPRQLGRDTMYKGRGRVVRTDQPTLAERKAAAAIAAAKGDAPEADADDAEPADANPAGEENR
ncbi:protein translocase subunit SecD [Demequina subtropica]|uniref:protein translocase subunit SecD n=1 Tax=Demequina subtropica TaxID=1638989 RepID=UPI000784D99F|nr:protein translocase subunit SecD [Demequina subtropica]